MAHFSRPSMRLSSGSAYGHLGRASSANFFYRYLSVKELPFEFMTYVTLSFYSSIMEYNSSLRGPRSLISTWLFSSSVRLSLDRSKLVLTSIFAAGLFCHRKPENRRFQFPKQWCRTRSLRSHSQGE
jgi:hypothetical protein